MKRMKEYDWPGNIRELQNSVERCLILRKADIIEPADLNLSKSQGGDTLEIPEIPADGISLEEVEKGLIIKAMQKSNGNRSQAARLLKIPRHVLIYRLEKFEL
jgi:two-component system NtrC family response regulator